MAAVAIALAVPSAAASQVANPSAVVAQPGDLVRLRTAQFEYTGRLVRVANDSALVQFGADSARIARSSVLRTDVQHGTRRSAPRIALLAVAGAAVGTIVGGYAGVLAECGTSCEGGSAIDGVVGGVSGATLGFVIGGVAGGVWGAQKRYPRWVEAVLAR